MTDTSGKLRRMSENPTWLNLGANYLNFIAGAALGLIVNPLLVGILGTTAFGSWKSCQRIFDVAAPPDGTASQALKWTVANARRTADQEQMRRLVGAAVAVWILWLPALAVISVVVLFVLPLLINGTTAAEDQMLSQAGLILSVNVLLTGLLSVPSSVLIGINKGYIAMGLATAALVSTNVGVLVAAQLGYGLAGVACVVVSVAVVGALATWFAARNSVEWWGVRRPTRADVTSLARFSGWMLVWSYVQRLLLSTEIILIGALAGAQTAGHYAFTAYGAQFALAVCGLTTSAFMPRLGSAIGKGDQDDTRSLTRSTREINLALVAVLGAGMLAFNGPFVAHWAGEQFYMGNAINVLIVLAFVQLAIIRWNAQVQDSGLNVRGRAIVGLLGAILSVALGASAYLVTRSLEWMFVAIIVGRVVLNLGFTLLLRTMQAGSRTASSHTRSYVAAVAVLGSGLALQPLVENANILVLIGLMALTGAVLVGLAYLLILSDATRTRVRLAVASISSGAST